jgi:hypothetical protein
MRAGLARIVTLGWSRGGGLVLAGVLGQQAGPLTAVPTSSHYCASGVSAYPHVARLGLIHLLRTVSLWALSGGCRTLVLRTSNPYLGS